MFDFGKSVPALETAAKLALADAKAYFADAKERDEKRAFTFREALARYEKTGKGSGALSEALLNRDASDAALEIAEVRLEAAQKAYDAVEAFARTFPAFR